MAKKKAKQKRPNPEVKAFAKALKEWAEKKPDDPDALTQEQKKRLLRWLLSRCESHGFKSHESKNRKEDNNYIIKRTGIKDIKIREAVMRAMKGYNPALPTSGWVRGGPFWLKGYGEFWQKAYGYGS